MRPLIKKGRLLFRLTIALFSRYTKHLFLGFLGGFLVIFLTIRVYPLVAAFFPERKTIGVIGVYTPTTLPAQIQNLVSFGLTKVNSEGEALPSLAPSWEVDDEGKIYTFRLREDVFWHDGEPFTAKDINYNLKDVEIKARDQFTVEFKLREPFSPLPALLSRPLFKKGLVGMGVYQVARLKLNVDRVDSITLTPTVENEHLPRLTYKFYPTEASAVTAFKLGEVDVLQELTDPHNFSSWEHLEIIKGVFTDRVVTIFYNTDSSLLQEKAFRQALNYAVPDLKEEKAFTSISPTSWAFSKNAKVYDFNLDKAQDLLKDRQATDSAALTLSTFPPFLSLAQKIAHSWEKLGVKTLVQVENSIPGQYEALLTIQQIPPDPDQYPLWHSTQEETNITNLKDPKIDKLLEDGRKAFKTEEREEIYADFQKYLADEAPAAFLYYPTVYTVSRK